MWLEAYLFPLALVLAAAALVSAGWAVVSGRAKFLAVAGVCILAAAAALTADWAIVTEAEKVEALIDDLAAAAVAGDADQALSHFSPATDIPVGSIRLGLAMTSFSPDMRLSDRGTTVTANGTQAVSDLRVNGTAQVKLSGIGGRYATRWQIVWRKEAGEWKIIELRRFDPLRGEEIGLLDRG